MEFVVGTFTCRTYKKVFSLMTPTYIKCLKSTSWKSQKESTDLVPRRETSVWGLSLNRTTPINPRTGKNISYFEDTSVSKVV